MLIDMIISSSSTYLKLISNHNSHYQVRYEMKMPSLLLQWRSRSGAMLLWQLGIIWKWALPRLACQMTIVKTGSYFFFNIIIGSHSRGHMPSARRGAHTCSWWLGQQTRRMGTWLHNKPGWGHCKHGQPWGMRLRYRALLTGDRWWSWLRDPASESQPRTPVGVLAGGQSLPKSAERDGVMASKPISDGQVPWQSLGTCIKMPTHHISYFCSPRRFHASSFTPFNRHRLLPRHMRTPFIMPIS